LNRHRHFFIGLSLFFCLLLQWSQYAYAQTKPGLRFPIKDRRASAIEAPSKNPYDIRDTTLIKKSVVFDPIVKTKTSEEHLSNERPNEGVYKTEVESIIPLRG
jgi:hypothetical protein